MLPLWHPNSLGIFCYWCLEAEDAFLVQPLLLPVDTSHTLLYDPLDLLKHVGVLLVDPVSEISSIIQDLQQNQPQSHCSGDPARAADSKMVQRTGGGWRRMKEEEDGEGR